MRLAVALLLAWPCVAIILAPFVGAWLAPERAVWRCRICTTEWAGAPWKCPNCGWITKEETR
jgi:hypothetical protein